MQAEKGNAGAGNSSADGVEVPLTDRMATNPAIGVYSDASASLSLTSGHTRPAKIHQSDSRRVITLFQSIAPISNAISTDMRQSPRREDIVGSKIAGQHFFVHLGVVQTQLTRVEVR